MTAKQIRAALKKTKMKQYRIAEKLGVTESLVSQVINRRSISKRVMNEIAHALNQPVETVFHELSGHDQENPTRRAS